MSANINDYVSALLGGSETCDHWPHKVQYAFLSEIPSVLLGIP